MALRYIGEDLLVQKLHRLRVTIKRKKTRTGVCPEKSERMAVQYPSSPTGRLSSMSRSGRRMPSFTSARIEA